MQPFHLPPSLFAVLFCLWIGLILGILRYISGWAALARVYRSHQSFSGKSYTFRSGSLNRVSFNNCLTLGTNRDELYLSVLFPFSLAFPALLIPWQEVTATTSKGLIFSSMHFRFQQVPSIAFSVQETLGRQLLLAKPDNDEAGRMGGL